MPTSRYVRHFAELDSTSSRAEAMLSAGEKPPFAVRADRQTAGRGRRGAAWESPAGNLFLTVVVPPGDEGAQLAPLKAAVLVAQFVEKHLGVRLTLKWPNDLLFGGAKVGGLLLEGSLRGDAFGAILIGIGLNLASAPDLLAPARAAALAKITGRGDLAPAPIGDALAAHLIDGWPRLAGTAAMVEFERYALQPGQLWTDGETLARLGGLAEDGGLELQTLAGENLRLNSVDHKFAWIYQGTGVQAAPLVVADCGNSSTKIAYYATADAEGPERLTRFEAGDATQMAIHLAALTQHLPRTPWPLFAASVNPAGLDALVRVGDDAGFDVIPLVKRAVRRRFDSSYALGELGLDRLAAIEGWLARPEAARGPALVVSAGTALTIDAVSEHGTHLGGVIAPGLQLSLDALHDATGLLPPLRFESTQPALGHGTKAAMRGGVLFAALGAIEAVARRAFPAAAPKVVLTGGGAGLLAPHLGAAAIVIPELIVSGARILALGGLWREGAT